MQNRWTPIVIVAGLLAMLCVCTGASALAVVQTWPSIAAQRIPPTPTIVRLSPLPPAPTPVVERLELVGRPLVQSVGGSTQVTGLARNPDSQPRSAILVATFQDSSGKAIGTAIGSVQNIQPNETKPFTLYANQAMPPDAKIDLKVQSRLPSNDFKESLITFADPRASSSAGGFQVIARATNSDGRPHKFTAVATLLDAAGNIVGIARGASPQMMAGGAGNVTLISQSPLPQYASIKVQVDLLEE